jgi:hypothetical protein
MNHRLDFYIIDKIKAALARKIGYVITTKLDCKKLSEIILSEGIGYISESTLYRLLLQSTDKNYYKSTLDIISVFLGFNNSKDLIDSLNNIKYHTIFNGINLIPTSKKNLLYYNIEGNNFHTLHHFFDSLDDCSIDIKGVTAISLFDALIHSTNSTAFFEKFARNKYVRNFLLEQLHDPHFRINNYDYAYKLYLKGLNIHTDINELQDYIFGSSVLFRSYYLKKNYKAASETGKKLYEPIPSLEEYNNNLHIFPFIRYSAYKLWYLNLVDEDSIKQFDYANYLIDLCECLQPNLNSIEQRIVFHTMAEVMLNSSLPHIFHKKLKYIFKDNFKTIPDSIFSKHIKYSLPYFEVNGLLYHRP